MFVLLIKVTLHETIRNGDFYRNTALQHCCDIVSNSYSIVPTLQRCVALKIVVANRSRGTSPLNLLFFRRSRCREMRRERLPRLKVKATQERNLCLQGRMGRFSEWSSLSFKVTITNFFGTIERFGITLISLQQTSHSDWQLLKLGQKVKSNSTGRALKNALFCRPRAVVLLSSEPRTANKKVKSPSFLASSPLAPHVCSVLSVHWDSKEK